jgi:hypothetical protein
MRHATDKYERILANQGNSSFSLATHPTRVDLSSMDVFDLGVHGGTHGGAEAHEQRKPKVEQHETLFKSTIPAGIAFLLYPIRAQTSLCTLTIHAYHCDMDAIDNDILSGS